MKNGDAFAGCNDIAWLKGGSFLALAAAAPGLAMADIRVRVSCNVCLAAGPRHVAAMLCA